MEILRTLFCFGRDFQTLMGKAILGLTDWDWGASGWCVLTRGQSSHVNRVLGM